MSTRTPMRSILKQSTPATPTAADDAAKAENDKRNLSIALNHANRIDLQKKIQRLILDNIETLMDLPTASPTTAKDATIFTNLIHPFQPSDFASLIDERRINGSCGYALCPNPPRSETLGASATWKLKGKGAGDFCSTECVRKALYVKAQLSGVPAWERVEGQQAAVVLPEEDRVVGEVQSGAVAGAAVGGTVANGRDLAAERGEEPASFKPRQVMMDAVVEKPRRSQQEVPAPSFPQKSTDGPGYGAIEGYESKFSSKRSKEDDSDSDEGDEAAAPEPTGGAAFTSEIINPDDEEAGFNEEEEAAWREMQTALRELNTGHDR